MTVAHFSSPARTLALASALACALGLLAPAALAQGTATAEALLAPFARTAAAQPAPPWRVVGVPGGKIAHTAFSLHTLDGQRVLRVAADRSYANLVHDLALMPAARTQLRWRWRLEQPLPLADLTTKQGDDSALKVCVLFDMPLDALGLFERNLFRLARAASSEKLPSATLCYVWDTTLKAQTVLANAYTQRVRMVVVAGAGQEVGQWQEQSRDVQADFRQLFGQESATVPPIIGVLVGGDADNTGGQSLGYIDALQLENR